ncbi:MAG: Methicillin resistance protein [Candidatus Beckwithbacteria bacterium GW2011_GWA2_43_10]|uniref:Methicillin resistance protein n=1 Tax=Candidatus Beckwithbacteria bacterium GW2011_GWA2_43_10 TaxID=1618369 RepID=A0A0G1C3W3_9BACT|nr:MAG: Methicillin resistance protein [Candidatus Beckwithbacteria bacterium GW2011_GWA2_43_10]
MLTVKFITDKKIWEKFLNLPDQINFLQSWNWGEFHLALGHKVFRLGLVQNNHLVGLALLIKIKAKRASYLECPGGPVLNWDNINQVKPAIQLIKLVAKQESVCFVRIRPNIIKADDRFQQLKKLGFIKAPMHLHAETTWILNLNQSEEELLKAMRKNTRYSIKQAFKLGVKVIKSLDETDIDTLYDLQLETVKRRKFTPFSKQYFIKQFQAFKADNQIQLFKAVYQDQILAIAFIIFYGQEAVYHYSGSSSHQRQIPASYALQWAAILEAKKRGMARYNFWGIAPTDNPRHRFSGVTLFKKGFGGQRVDYLPAHDLITRSDYWFNFIIESFRRLYRHL